MERRPPFAAVKTAFGRRLLDHPLTPSLFKEASKKSHLTKEGHPMGWFDVFMQYGEPKAHAIGVQGGLCNSSTATWFGRGVPGSYNTPHSPE